MNKMEKNSSERLLKQLIAALKLEGNQMPGGVLESDDYNIIIIKPNQLQQENAGEKQSRKYNESYSENQRENFDDLYGERKGKKELENIISRKLIGLGIPTRLKGYKYILAAIEQVLEDETSLEGVTKILYPDVAKKYNSTPQRVEKAIRHAIEVAWTDNVVELRREFDFVQLQGQDTGLPALYNPQIQISAESETKRSIFREKDKTKRSKKESAQHSKSRNKSFVMTSVSAL